MSMILIQKNSGPQAFALLASSRLSYDQFSSLILEDWDEWEHVLKTFTYFDEVTGESFGLYYDGDLYLYPLANQAPNPNQVPAPVLNP